MTKDEQLKTVVKRRTQNVCRKKEKEGTSKEIQPMCRNIYLEEAEKENLVEYQSSAVQLDM